MKHTFYFIDRLMYLIKHVPSAIKNNGEAEDAKKLIDDLEKYARTLKKLIDNHKNTEYLRRLHAAHDGNAAGWADKITSLFAKLDELLEGLEEYAEKLKKILESGRYDVWGHEIGNLAMRMYFIGLHDEEEAMEKMRKLEIVEVNRLREIIDYEEHIAELLR